MCYQIWNLPIRSFGNLAYPKPSTCDSGGEARGVTHYCSIFPSGACLSLEESLSDGTMFLRMSSHPHNLVHVPLWQLLPRGGLFRGHPLLSSYLILNHISPSIPRSIQCHLLIPTVAPLFIAHCYAYSIDLPCVRDGFDFDTSPVVSLHICSDIEESCASRHTMINTFADYSVQNQTLLHFYSDRSVSIL